MHSHTVHQCILGATIVTLGTLAHHTRAGDDLRPLSDEFDSSSTIIDWPRIHETEQWGAAAEQLEHYSIDSSTAPGQPGRLVMMPHTCTWYRDYRGPMAFKSIAGDFVVTTRLRVSGRDGVSIPSSIFSLAGLMARTPQAITPATWTAGGEDYIFLSLGYGFGPAQWQYEVKTTDDSDSILTLSPAPANEAVLQLARLGEFIIALRQDQGGAWQVHRRFHRADLPAELQVGLISYTDWPKVEIFDPFVHNGAALRSPLPPGVIDPNPFIPFTPDLIASFDYARFARPAIPAELLGADFSEGGPVSDAQLLSFLGASPDVPFTPACPGDADADGAVGLSDIAAITTHWSLTVPPAPASADLDASGDIGLGDIAVVIQNWGAACR